MSGNKKYLEEASIGMALMDAVPVLLFCAGIILMAKMFDSVLFLIGGILCVVAGLGKVIWKFALAVMHRNVLFLNKQFKYVMGSGFLMIIVAVVVAVCTGQSDVNFSYVWKNVSAFPGNILFLCGMAGMIGMIILGSKMDASSKRVNYLEQTVNLIAQLCFFLGIMLIWYASDSYAADGKSLEALADSEGVNVVQVKQGANQNVILFDGKGEDTALVFYPGAKVEYTAYAPILHDLATAGIDCFVVEMPYNMAIFGVNSATKLIDECSAGGLEINNKKGYSHWYVGGHSLGGAMAAGYATEHAHILDGGILFAEYSTMALDSAQLKVISVYGSEDDVLNMEKYEEYKKHLPSDYCEFVIEGGNHAGFGSYGEQAGDGKASISREEQWAMTRDVIVSEVFD